MKTLIKIDKEVLSLIVVAILFLLIGLSWSEKLQPVWVDEVALTDAASNLYLYGKFTSSAVYHQLNNEFHVSPSFLYTFSLFLWMKIVGFSIIKVRFFNYLLMVISGGFLCLFVKQLDLITIPWIRFLLFASFLTIGGIDYIYVSGRYDTMGILLSLLACYFFSLKDNRKRFLGILGIGFLFPLSGLSSLVFALVFILILLVFNYSLFWKESFFMTIGFVCGFSFLYFLYSLNGVWDDFLNLSFGFSSVKQTSGKVNLITLLIQTFSRLSNSKDYTCAGCIAPRSSFSSLTILALVLVIYQFLVKSFKLKSFLPFCLTVAFVVPVLLCFLAKYPLYYSWMTVIPLLLCIFFTINKMIIQKSFTSLSDNIIYLISALLILKSVYLGLPSTILFSSHEWNLHGYKQVEDFIDNNIKTSDIIYADFPVFYAVKGKAKKVYFPLYQGQMTDHELNELSVIVIDPREEVRESWNPGLSGILKNKISQWKDTGIELNNSFYHLKIYRKEKF